MYQFCKFQFKLFVEYSLVSVQEGELPPATCITYVVSLILKKTQENVQNLLKENHDDFLQLLIVLSINMCLYAICNYLLV